MKQHRRPRKKKAGKYTEWPRFPIDQPRPTLVILAGPSGSGKSTFTRALYRGHLPDSIRELLPAQISAAPTVDIKYPANFLVTSMLERQEVSPKNGCILHYSLNRIRQLGIKDIRDDPELLAFLSNTKSLVVIINIIVGKKTLAKQYLNRLFLSHKTVMQGGLTFTKVKFYKILDYRKIYKFLRYRFSDAVNDMYRDWECIVSQIGNDGDRRTPSNVRVIGVERDTARKGETESFRLVYCLDGVGKS